MRIRERLQCDDGMSLVEMLVAMVVLSIAMLALVNGLIASAASVVDQRGRTTATRVASESLETLRNLGFQEIQDQIAAGTFVGSSTVSADGHSYDVDTTVTEVEAETGASPPTPGEPTVLLIDTTVGWTAGTLARTVAHRTAIAPREVGGVAAGTPAINSINMNPSPSTVVAGGALDGEPTAHVSVTVILQGFDDTALVKVTWVNDGGATKSKFLSSGDGGQTWTGIIDKADIRRAVPAGEQGDVAFTIHAESLTSMFNLPVVGQDENPPVITDASVTPSSINLKKNGTNVADVTFWATVDQVNTTDPADPQAATVRLKYQLNNGKFQEISLEFTGTRWERSVPAGSEKFKSGTNQEFVFTVLRNDNGSATATRFANVVGG